MERMFEKDVILACEELGIGFVPFGPLASGFLSGKVTANATNTGDDVRRVIARFRQRQHPREPAPAGPTHCIRVDELEEGSWEPKVCGLLQDELIQRAAPD